jgi:hypothetical protein
MHTIISFILTRINGTQIADKTATCIEEMPGNQRKQRTVFTLCYLSNRLVKVAKGIWNSDSAGEVLLLLYAAHEATVRIAPFYRAGPCHPNDCEIGNDR